MPAPSPPQAKGRSESAEKPPSLRSPTPETGGLASPLLGLQQAAGNGAVGRLLQAKLRIGPPGDAYEREADRVADAVLRGDAAVPVSVAGTGAGVQRMCAKCKEEEEELLQPKAAGPPRVEPGFESRIESLRGSGSPLPTDLRGYFEPRFGHDFEAVRLHTGAAAGEAARAVNARAFTVGNDVVFGGGEWSPETTAGKSLLAHELTHVVQQTPLARRKPLLQRAPQEAGEAAPETDSAPQPESPAPSPEPSAPGKPATEAAPADRTPAAAVVVEDDATGIGEGQMTKSEFLARLRTEVCAAAEAGLSGTQYSARGCPLIEFWLGYYGDQSAERINETLPRFVEEGRRPATAEGYISVIAARVRTSVTTWARTGEITGVPRGLPLPGMGLPALGSLGGLLGGLGSLGGVFFKAKPGGPRDPGDPVALQARLGAGRSLDGTIRSRMESAFGRSFAHVRVHTDGGAARMSDSLNARAFTVGPHVAFGAREYRPGTLAGDALIAHELAHVAQQETGETAGGLRASPGPSYESLELDADIAAAGAVASIWGGMRGGRALSLGSTSPRQGSRIRLQRCAACGTPQRTLPEVRQLAQVPSQLCDPAERTTHPERPCCTPKMLQEVQSYRALAADAVARAHNATAPANASSVASELQAHFRLTPGDSRVADVHRQFGDMERELKQGDIEFRCRDEDDMGLPCGLTPKGWVRASSNNCPGMAGTRVVWICGHYAAIKNPESDAFLDSSWLHTMIHEFAHVGCTPPTRITGSGSEIYYRGEFPGTADQAVMSADAYANFALAVR